MIKALFRDAFFYFKYSIKITLRLFDECLLEKEKKKIRKRKKEQKEELSEKPKL
jgi:hypothetical protein